MNRAAMNQDMSEQEMVELISSHEVFSGFGQTELEQLRSVVSFREAKAKEVVFEICLLYTSPSPRDRQKSRMPSSA